MDSPTNPQIPGYTIEEQIGSGGQGVVFRAIQQSTGREVAIKVISTRVQGKQLERLEREALALTVLRHPNVIRIHEAGEAAGCRYLVLDLIKGMALRDVMQARALGPRALAGVLAKVADGLASVHASEIVHRDVKPENILLDGDGEPHLVDFGLGKLPESIEALTQTGVAIGTPLYIAPEVLRNGSRSAQPACDVYALGLILYEGLLGMHPVQGASWNEIYVQLLCGTRIPLPRDVDPALRKICELTAASKPEERPTAAELSEMLEAATRSVVVRRSTPAKAAFAVSGAALLLVCLGFGIASVRSDPNDDAPPPATPEEAGRKPPQATLGARKSVEEAIRIAERGRDGWLQRALSLVEVGNPVVTRMVAVKLEDLCSQLEDAEREVWSKAVQPLPKEAAAGDLVITGFPEAWVARRRRDLLVTPLASHHARALMQISNRRWNRLGRPEARIAALHRECAAAQNSSPGEQNSRVARLFCELLALPNSEEAGVIARYLRTESDLGRALAASRCMLRVGTPAAYEEIVVVRQRFQSTSLPTQIEAQMATLASTLEADPKTRPSLKRLRAIDLGGRGETKGAVDELTALLALRPDDAQAYYLRGVGYMALGEFNKAMDDMSAAIRLDSNFTMAWYNRGLLRMQREDYMGAFKDMGQVLQVNPRSGDALRMRARLHMLLGKNVPWAMQDLGLALNVDPRNFDAWIERGYLRQSEGDLRGAIEDYTQAIALDGSSAQAWSYRGIANMHLGDLQRADDDCSRAMYLEPEAWNNWYHRAMIQQSKGDYVAALRDCARAIELDPSDPVVWELQGSCLMELNRPAEAVKALGEALKRTPEPQRAFRYRLRGIARSFAGNPVGAREDFDELLALSPNDPTAWLISGKLEREQKHYVRAEQDFLRSASLNPMDPAPQILAGICAWLQGNESVARAAFAVAAARGDPAAITYEAALGGHPPQLASIPESGMAYRWLAQWYLGNISTDEMLATAAKVSDVSTRGDYLAEIHMQIGMAELRHGKKEAARAAFEISVAAGSGTPIAVDLARAALDLLKEP